MCKLKIKTSIFQEINSGVIFRNGLLEGLAVTEFTNDGGKMTIIPGAGVEYIILITTFKTSFISIFY